jgi:hypothetical protein
VVNISSIWIVALKRAFMSMLEFILLVHAKGAKFKPTFVKTLMKLWQQGSKDFLN